MKAKKAKEPGVLFGLSLKVTIALVLAIIALIAILLHIFIPKAREEIAFGTAVAGGAAVVYGAYYAGVSLKVATEQTKKHRSFQMLQNLNRIDMVRVRLLIENEVSEKNISPEELYKKMVGDQKLLSAVTTLLGLFEDISVGIQFGYLDEDVLFYSLGFLLPWHFEGLKYYVEEERKKNNESRLYCEAEKLSHAWKPHTSLLHGEIYKFPD